MVNIATKHSPWAYSETQIAEMLLIHSHMPAKSITYVFTEPAETCGPDCQRCARDRENA